MEDTFIIVFDTITLIISLVLLIKSYMRMTRTKKTVYLVHFVFFAIYVFPIALDIFYDYPNYGANRAYYGFYISHKDSYVRLVYDVIIIISQLIILYIGNRKPKLKKNRNSDTTDNKEILITKFDSPITNIVLFFLGSFTVLSVLLSPLPKQMLYIISWRETGLVILSEQMKVYYYFVERFAFISLVSAVIFILANKHKHRLLKILTVLFMMMTICVQSKRAIVVVLFFVILSFIVFNKKGINTKKFTIILGLMALVTLYYSMFILISNRGYTIGSDGRLYTLLRIDFFRDDRLRMVIYSLLYPANMNIIEYPFQSFINQIGALFPLEYLGLQVTGYNSFFTSALRGIPFTKSVNSMTTSFFDESLANFGFLGFWIAPSIYGKICHVADEYTSLIRPLVVSTLLFMLMLPLNYIFWFIQTCIIILFIEKRIRRIND